MKLLGISGSLIGEKLPGMMREVLNHVQKNDPGISIELMDLRDYAVEFVDGRPFSQYNRDTRTAVGKIKEADLFIIGSPVYQASISGALKNLFDHLPPNVFEGKVVGLVMTGGTEKHYLVLEHHLRPIVTFLKGTVPPKTLFFHQDDDIYEDRIQRRIEEFVKELLHFQAKWGPGKN